MLVMHTEVDRAIDNLMKSGKMFGPPGRRKSWLPCCGGPSRYFLDSWIKVGLTLCVFQTAVRDRTWVLDQTNLAMLVEDLSPQTCRTFTPTRDISPHVAPARQSK